MINDCISAGFLSLSKHTRTCLGDTGLLPLLAFICPEVLKELSRVGISFTAHHSGFYDHSPSPSSKHVPTGGAPRGHPMLGFSGLSIEAARWAELASQATA